MSSARHHLLGEKRPCYLNTFIRQAKDTHQTEDAIPKLSYNNPYTTPASHRPKRLGEALPMSLEEKKDEKWKPLRENLSIMLHFYTIPQAHLPGISQTPSLLSASSIAAQSSVQPIQCSVIRPSVMRSIAVPLQKRRSSKRELIG